MESDLEQLDESTLDHLDYILSKSDDRHYNVVRSIINSLRPGECDVRKAISLLTRKAHNNPEIQDLVEISATILAILGGMSPAKGDLKAAWAIYEEAYLDPSSPHVHFPLSDVDEALSAAPSTSAAARHRSSTEIVQSKASNACTKDRNSRDRHKQRPSNRPASQPVNPGASSRSVNSGASRSVNSGAPSRSAHSRNSSRNSSRHADRPLPRRQAAPLESSEDSSPYEQTPYLESRRRRSVSHSKYDEASDMSPSDDASQDFSDVHHMDASVSQISGLQATMQNISRALSSLTTFGETNSDPTDQLGTASHSDRLSPEQRESLRRTCNTFIAQRTRTWLRIMLECRTSMNRNALTRAARKNWQHSAAHAALTDMQAVLALRTKPVNYGPVYAYLLDSVLRKANLVKRLGNISRKRRALQCNTILSQMRRSTDILWDRTLSAAVKTQRLVFDRMFDGNDPRGLRRSIACAEHVHMLSKRLVVSKMHAAYKASQSKVWATQALSDERGPLSIDVGDFGIQFLYEVGARYSQLKVAARHDRQALWLQGLTSAFEKVRELSNDVRQHSQKNLLLMMHAKRASLRDKSAEYRRNRCAKFFGLLHHTRAAHLHTSADAQLSLENIVLSSMHKSCMELRTAEARSRVVRHNHISSKIILPVYMARRYLPRRQANVLMHWTAARGNKRFHALVSNAAYMPRVGLLNHMYSSFVAREADMLEAKEKVVLSRTHWTLDRLAALKIAVHDDLLQTHVTECRRGHANAVTRDVVTALVSHLDRIRTAKSQVHRITSEGLWLKVLVARHRFERTSDALAALQNAAPLQQYRISVDMLTNRARQHLFAKWLTAPERLALTHDSSKDPSTLRSRKAQFRGEMARIILSRWFATAQALRTQQRSVLVQDIMMRMVATRQVTHEHTSRFNAGHRSRLYETICAAWAKQLQRELAQRACENWNAALRDQTLALWNTELCKLEDAAEQVNIRGRILVRMDAALAEYKDTAERYKEMKTLESYPLLKMEQSVHNTRAKSLKNLAETLETHAVSMNQVYGQRFSPSSAKDGSYDRSVQWEQVRALKSMPPMAGPTPSQDVSFLSH